MVLRPSGYIYISSQCLQSETKQGPQVKAAPPKKYCFHWGPVNKFSAVRACENLNPLQPSLALANLIRNIWFRWSPINHVFDMMVPQKNRTFDALRRKWIFLRSLTSDSDPCKDLRKSHPVTTLNMIKSLQLITIFLVKSSERFFAGTLQKSQCFPHFGDGVSYINVQHF